jgi:small subunit ribosomal protein S16
MQRTGRKGHAMFRVVVQDSRRTPSSGKIVASLGSYDPHAKAVILDKEKAAFYLEHGAQPSDRVARLLKAEGVKLPSWVKTSADKVRAVRNPEKRRSTTPAEEAPAEEPAVEEPTAEAPAEEPATEEAAAE